MLVYIFVNEIDSSPLKIVCSFLPWRDGGDCGVLSLCVGEEGARGVSLYGHDSSLQCP